MGATSYLAQGRDSYRFSYDHAGIYYCVCFVAIEYSLEPDVTR